MKTLLTILSIFLSFNTASAATMNWSDLEPGSKYRVLSEIRFNDEVKLSAGDVFIMEESFSAEAPVLFFTFNNTSCRDFNLTAEMILFNPEPEDTLRDKSVGISLDLGCKVTVYVEPKYFYSKSFLED